MTYVVRRFKPKLLVFITTGTFNLLSKILTTLRLSGAVWIEADIAIGCPRTCAQTVVRFRVQPFLAPFPDYLKFCLLVNSFVFTLISSRTSSLITVETRRANSRIDGQSRVLKNRCCANFERSTSAESKNGPSQFWLARRTTNRGPWVLQWDCSLRDSLQGIRGTCLTCPNEPASLSLAGWLPNRTGPLQKLHCLKTTF
jgi:hypothetical protein